MKVKATGIKNFKIVKKNYVIAHGLLYKLKLLGTLQLNSHFQTTDIKESFSMVNHRNGLQLKQVFHKVQFWTCFSSLFTLMICHKDCVATRNFLLTTLHGTITSPAISSSNLNEDLLKITQWAYQWKMSFDPDIKKQTQEIIFFSKEKL